MTTVPLFDCDNHIYEPPDAATRLRSDPRAVRQLRSSQLRR